MMGKLTNMTVKGQITIPKDVRDALGLRPGEPVEVNWTGGQTASIRRPRHDRAAEIEAIKAQIVATSRRYAHLRDGRPTDEIMRELRPDDPHLR